MKLRILMIAGAVPFLALVFFGNSPADQASRTQTIHDLSTTA